MSGFIKFVQLQDDTLEGRTRRLGQWRVDISPDDKVSGRLEELGYCFRLILWWYLHEHPEQDPFNLIWVTDGSDKFIKESE